jgi:hypothetical protein
MSWICKFGLKFRQGITEAVLLEMLKAKVFLNQVNQKLVQSAVQLNWRLKLPVNSSENVLMESAFKLMEFEWIHIYRAPFHTLTGISNWKTLLWRFQVAAVNTAMAALTKTVNVFPTERLIVQREQAKGSYALTPYLVAKLVAEAPVSAAFPLMFGAILYPMARLHPTLGRFYFSPSYGVGAGNSRLVRRSYSFTGIIICS